MPISLRSAANNQRNSSETCQMLSSSEQECGEDLQKATDGHENNESSFMSKMDCSDVSPCDHIDKSTMHVGEVLREAENIVHDRGTARLKLDEGSEVLVDEVDIQYKPHHDTFPIEIIVRHNTVVSQTSQPKENSIATKITHRNRSHFCGYSGNQGFKKCHRRAFSMPNEGGISSALTIIDNEKQLLADGLHKRHVVRYRLHPQNVLTTREGNSERNPVILGLPTHLPLDDDNELEIEINEEEIISPQELEFVAAKRTVIKKFWEARWKVTNFEFLPDWLQDNEYLRTGHRPPLPSFGSCVKSIFSLHTETGNIWTHMYGCAAFIGVAAWFLTRPSDLIQWQEKFVFSFFFMGAIACLGMSFSFHTLQCHSAEVGRLFSKLDYTGITLLIVGSFIPWIYYGFHCRPQPMIIYLTMINVLGVAALVVSLWDRFAKPHFRPVRAIVFVAMGLSSIFPVFHNLITDGPHFLLNELSLHWLVLMGVLYLIGAALYATRTPERFFPGKCDIWFQSHQIFHMFVVAAAFVHFHGITELAMRRLEKGSCAEQLLERYGSENNPSFIGSWLNLDDS